MAHNLRIDDLGIGTVYTKAISNKKRYRMDSTNTKGKNKLLTGVSAMKSAKIPDTEKFESVISHGVALVDFNAPWCAPCRVQYPIIEELSEIFKGRAAILEINVDENKQTAMHLGIASIPTLIIFKDGKEVTRFVGLQNAESLSKAIRRTLRQ